MPVLSESTSFSSLYLLLGCALVLLCIFLHRKSNASRVKFIAMSSSSSSEGEKEDLAQVPRRIKSYQPDPGPRIPPPPHYQFEVPSTNTTAGPFRGVNPDFPESSYSRMPKPLMKSQSSTSSSQDFSPSTTRTFSTSSTFTAQTPITPFSAQKHTFTDSPTSYTKFPPFPAPTSRSYDSAIMPAHTEIPNESPYMPINRGFGNHTSTARESYAGASSNTSRDYYRAQSSDSDSEPSPTSSYLPNTAVSVDVPRRRSYTKTTTTIAGPELLEGQIEIGESWRRHTRVFGGGVCKACEESERRMGNWIKAGGAAMMQLNAEEGIEEGAEVRRRSA